MNEDISYYIKRKHLYICEECNYRWEEEEETDREKESLEESLEYEDSFNDSSLRTCPVCGSEYVTEQL